MRKSGLNKSANNSISESAHAGLTRGMEQSGTIRIDHAAAEGQTRKNRDMDRCHERYIKNRNNREVEVERKDMGAFHRLPSELQQSLIEAGRSHKGKMRKYFDESLAAQGEARRRKEEIVLEKKLGEVCEDYIAALYLHKQMSSPRCCRTVPEAEYFYKALKSKTARLRAVKEPILSCYLGCGWDKAHHPWSRNG